MAADSKTEKATPKKRRDERKEGNIFQSNDIVTVTFVFVAFYSLSLLAPAIVTTVSDFFVRFIYLSNNIVELTPSTVTSVGYEFAKAAAQIILPFALICMSVGIVMHGIQTKFLFTAKNFYPKFSRLSPMQGIKKIFSLKNAVELVKNMIKVAILVLVVYNILIGISGQVVRTMDMSLENSVVYAFDRVINLIFTVTLIFTVIAFFDYLYQRWEYERKIKMSKQEVKEEYKQTEGNPEIKSKIKEMQRVRARSRMIQAVPSADVIIRNPTHVAVALKYDTEKNGAPIVLAKGVDELAMRIIDVATKHSVAVVENIPLARAIYAETEVGREIPAKYYSAVAEVLVYVYRLNNKLRRSDEKNS